MDILGGGVKSRTLFMLKRLEICGIYRIGSQDPWIRGLAIKRWNKVSICVQKQMENIWKHTKA
jgi:hypothetical protein